MLDRSEVCEMLNTTIFESKASSWTFSSWNQDI